MNNKIPRLIGSRHEPESEIEKLVQLAIRNTNWEEYQKRVDAGVAREVDAYAEARFKSIGFFQRLVLN